MSWTDTVNKGGLKVGEYLLNTYHAITPAEGDLNKKWYQRLPSMHRLWNAGGMFGFFLIGGWLRDVLRGFDKDGKEIAQEDVILPARFLHGLLHHNPHSDSHKDQWRKVICQLIPACFGAFGAIAGSVAFFKLNGREQRYNEALKKPTLLLTEADEAASYAQSWPMRILAGVFATFSAASGLTLLYGFFLNGAFSLSSNRKMWGGAAELTGINAFRHPTNTMGETFNGAQDYLVKNIIGESKDFFARYAHNKGGTPSREELENLQGRLVNMVTMLFPKYSKEHAEQMRAGAKKIIEEVERECVKSGRTPQEVGLSAKNYLADLFNPQAGKKDNFIGSLQTYFGMSKADLKEAVPGNNGWFGWLSNVIRKSTGDKTMESILNKWVGHVEVHAR